MHLQPEVAGDRQQPADGRSEREQTELARRQRARCQNGDQEDNAFGRRISGRFVSDQRSAPKFRVSKRAFGRRKHVPRARCRRACGDAG